MPPRYRNAEKQIQWEELVQAARNHNISRFRNLHNKYNFTSYGTPLSAAWNNAQIEASQQAPPRTRNVTLNNLRIGNSNKYRLGNNVYTRLNKNHFLKNGRIYTFSTATSGRNGSGNAAGFWNLPKSTVNSLRPASQNVRGNVGYKPIHHAPGLYYKVKRAAPGLNIWLPTSSNKAYKKTITGHFY
jgi:hypothetical protein